MLDAARQIRENLARVRQQIAAAAARSGRRAEEITLVGVTKYVDAVCARNLVAAGCTVLGESRPQELWRKAEGMADLDIQWHLIGQLQRNKIRRTLPLAALIHSVDSPRSVAAIELIAQELGLSVPVLLEVNVSGEPAKHGFAPAEVAPLLDELPGLGYVKVRGLMCMAGLEGGPEQARRDFAALRTLRDRLQPNCPEGVRLNELSMGMSGDFEEAVAEGSTIVRVGSALFEGVAL
jgi:pyridoxal phosphate enzyme (YggS family)